MNSISAKRVMIAAPKSGSGKTTITCALLEVLKREGLEPVSFKCGPDYIDPMFHKKVLGVESRNLDTFFAGKEGIRDSLSKCGDGYTVIEAVMGLYDGLSPESGEGSGYDIATALKSPVILVFDAHGAGRTMISLIKGMLFDDTEHLIKGIILNRISEGFYERLRPVLEKELKAIRGDVRLLGFFPKAQDLVIESRHLGLRLPGEIEDLKKKIEAAADILKQRVDIDAVLSIMNSAESFGISSTEPDAREQGSVSENTASGKGPVKDLTLAVAYDEAFCFYYRDNLELFEKLGVSIKFFSPIRDKALPEGCDGLLLGGGYPENYLKELSMNTSMLTSVSKTIDRGIPSLAECGGFMYLHRTVRDKEGRPFDLVGAVDGECSYLGRLVRFGYLEIAAVNHKSDAEIRDRLAQSLVGMRGHEFHYYESTANGSAVKAAKPDGSRSFDSMVIERNGVWGFPHFYYGSAPDFVREFVSRMREVKYGEFQ